MIKILGVGIPSLRAKETGKIIDTTINFTKTPYSAGDVLEIAIPVNTEVTDVYYSVTAACTDGGARTLGIGDTATGATKWATAVDMTTAAVGVAGPEPFAGNDNPTVYPLTKSATAAALYAAADVLKLTLNHNMTTGAIRIVAYGKIIG
jgi:hypothetical protein